MSEGPMPSIDVVIAIHDARRRLDRAVESVLVDAPGEIRVIVVCHGIDPDSIAPMLDGVPRDRVTVLKLTDGVRSPAGPFNEGIDASGADYVAVMGSDDFLEPGALRAWQRMAAAGRPDAVIGEQRHQNGDFIASPLVRRGRSRNLDVVRDRLYYRTAPLGILRREYLNDHQLRFTPGVASGEDLVLSTLLWSFGRVDLARGCPRYVIGADAPERTSYAVRRFSEVAEAVIDFVDEPRIVALPLRLRRALAVRLTRTAILVAIRSRGAADDWDDGQVASARRVLERLDGFAPGFLAPFARADRAMLDQVTRDPVSAAAAGARRGDASRFADVVPRNPLRTFDRESTAVRYLVYALDRGRSVAPPAEVAR